MNYIAFIHRDKAGYGISFPDFPGCISVGATREDALRHGAGALAFHIEGLVEDGLPIPRPRSPLDIKADPSLTEWQQDATLAWYPLPPTKPPSQAAKPVSTRPVPGSIRCCFDSSPLP